MVLEKRSEAETFLTQSSAVGSVRDLPIFSSLSTRVRGKLRALISVEQVPAKTLLVAEGQTQEWLFVHFRGLLQLFTQAAMHETTLAILKAPIIVNADAIPHHTVPIASVRTLHESCVGRIKVRRARQLFKEEREFADAVTDELAKNCRNMLRECKGSRSRNGFERLIAWILAMQDGAEAASEIKLPYDKTILAARLGVAPATLSRDFARLAPLGVTVRGRTLEIRDAKRLRELMAIDALNMPPVP